VRASASKIELLDTRGEPLRFIPGEVGRAMVDPDHAVVAAGKRPREIRQAHCDRCDTRRAHRRTTPLCGPSAVRLSVTHASVERLQDSMVYAYDAIIGVVTPFKEDA
jgi:hypothetical protein